MNTTQNSPLHLWKFCLNPNGEPANPDYNDQNWLDVEVPHDWAISGEFDRKNDIHLTAVIEDGEKAEREHTGRTGGLPLAGEGWYRRELDIPNVEADLSHYLFFEGVMSNSTV